MYRPDEAFGMMSVMSAQSTARKIPVERPNRLVPIRATGNDGATRHDRSPMRTDQRSSRR